MKFIRDIIAEKTNSGRSDAHPPVDVTASDPAAKNGFAEESEIFDPVQKVASGGMSLSPTRPGIETGVEETDAENTDELRDQMADGYASPGDQVDEFVPPTSEELRNSLSRFGDDLGFASVPEEAAKDDAPEPCDAEPKAPSELFANLWASDQEDSETGEDDLFADEDDGYDTDDESVFGAYDDEPNTAQDSVDDVVPPSDDISGDTNAAALMRTMYPEEADQPPAPEAYTLPEEDMVQPAPTAPSEQSERQAPETPAPASAPVPDASPLHEMLQRQEIQAPDSTPTLTGEVSQAPRVAMPSTAPVQVPAPAAGRSRRQAGRVKTRLLGFGTGSTPEPDMFARENAGVPAAQTMHPVGWIVVVSGPGRGNAFTLFNGVSQIGRGEDQSIRLDFGDSSISRENHAAIAYDPEQQSFYLGHGGKANLVRLNDTPVLSTERIETGALIRLGETTLRFVALCGHDFDWRKGQEDEGDNARFV